MPRANLGVPIERPDANILRFRDDAELRLAAGDVLIAVDADGQQGVIATGVAYET